MTVLCVDSCRETEAAVRPVAQITGRAGAHVRSLAALRMDPGWGRRSTLRCPQGVSRGRSGFSWGDIRGADRRSAHVPASLHVVRVPGFPTEAPPLSWVLWAESTCGGQHSPSRWLETGTSARPPPAFRTVLGHRREPRVSSTSDSSRSVPRSGLLVVSPGSSCCDVILLWG